MTLPTQQLTRENYLMAKGTVERFLENIFDGVFSRAFKSGVKPLQIGRRLLQVVDSERDLDAQGRRVVQMSAADREGFAGLEGSLLQELTAALREYIATEGYRVEGKARKEINLSRITVWKTSGKAKRIRSQSRSVTSTRPASSRPHQTSRYCTTHGLPKVSMMEVCSIFQRFWIPWSQLVM
jgi:hypothetical protein